MNDSLYIGEMRQIPVRSMVPYRECREGGVGRWSMREAVTGYKLQQKWMVDNGVPVCRNNPAGPQPGDEKLPITADNAFGDMYQPRKIVWRDVPIVEGES